jgi:hypothetical protein
MLAWEDRPVEVANLLNPAFCAEVLRRCIREYEAQSSQRLPYPLVFLVLPILLHGKTRNHIFRRQRQTLHAWLHNYPDVRVGFGERARSLVPVTREALAFLLHAGAVQIDDQGALSSIQYKGRRSRPVQVEGDAEDCYGKAEIVGRWFARAGTTATIFAMWGVKP